MVLSINKKVVLPESAMAGQQREKPSCLIVCSGNSRGACIKSTSLCLDKELNG